VADDSAFRLFIDTVGALLPADPRREVKRERGVH